MRHQSVVGIAALSLALAVGCSKKPDDAAVVTNIKSQMFSDAQLKDASLQVTSHDGQVTLTGDVPNDAAHLEAYKIASQTPGVTKVIDQMTVQTAETPMETPKQTPATAPSAPTRKPPAKKRSRLPDGDEVAQEAPPPPPAPTPTQQDVPVAQPAPAPAAAPVPPPQPQPKQAQVPAGATMTIRMIDGVDSSVNRAGEIFHASLDAPLVVDDQVVVSKGADVYVRLASASSAGHVSGESELHLELVKLDFQGQSYSLISSTYSLSGSSRGKDTAKKVGAGAILGTLLGAAIGRGKGAAIGAGVGASAGGVYQASTRGKQVKVPAETKLDFQLEQPVNITVHPRSTTSDQ